MIGEVIARIKTGVPALKMVGTAMNFQSAVESNPPVTPCCFVITMGEQPGPRVAADIMLQPVKATIAIVFAVRNLADKHGAAAGVDLEVVRKQVRDLVYGWQAAPGLDPFERGSGNLLTFRDGHVWWQDLFITSYYDRSVL